MKSRSFPTLPPLPPHPPSPPHWARANAAAAAAAAVLALVPSARLYCAVKHSTPGDPRCFPRYRWRAKQRSAKSTYGGSSVSSRVVGSVHTPSHPLLTHPHLPPIP
jgi:hypothetical protein